MYNICITIIIAHVPIWMFLINMPCIQATTSVCREGFIPCENATKCVQIQNKCDGNKDCPDGSDERNCSSDSLDYEFWDHFYRKRPSAEHDDLDPTCKFVYSGHCFCRSSDILCQNMDYRKVPDDLPQNKIDLLDISGNVFETLSYETLKSLPSEVKTLALYDNKIKKLVPGAFHNISSLTTIRLDNNELEYFPAGVFPENSSLTTLVVRHNKLSRIHDDAFVELTYLEELDLNNNRLTTINEKMLEPLENLVILYLNGNRIRHVDKSTFPSLPLRTLSLADNQIESIEYGAFSSLSALRSLYLSNNRLTSLWNGTFLGLEELQILTLDYNSIRVIERGVFHDTYNLSSLKLKENNFRTIDKSVLLPLKKLQHIYFDRFEMCLNITSVMTSCYPRGDGISSQEDLLANPILRASVWIMGAIGCTGNLVVLLGRLLVPTANVVHSLYIRNLAFSDFLMGIYLFIIASVDQLYRGDYLQHEKDWRHSCLCNLCGFLSTVSCESSVLILSLVTWDRFVSVTQPLARKQPSPRTAALTLILLWMIAACVAVAPLSKISENFFGNEFYGSNGVCLSLHIHEPYATGWQYSAVMYVLVNAIALVFICYAYCRMIKEIRASGVACRSTQQSQERDKVAQRFGIIVFTNCACWVPVIIVKICALAGLPISEDLYAWLAILVLPINCALNPVLYTLSTTMFKKQIMYSYVMFNSCIHKRRTEQHSGFDSGASLSLGMFPIGGSTRRVLTYRGTQSSVTTSRNSWRRPTAV